MAIISLHRSRSTHIECSENVGPILVSCAPRSGDVKLGALEREKHFGMTICSSKKKFVWLAEGVPATLTVRSASMPARLLSMHV